MSSATQREGSFQAGAEFNAPGARGGSDLFTNKVLKVQIPLKFLEIILIVLIDLQTGRTGYAIAPAFYQRINENLSF